MLIMKRFLKRLSFSLSICSFIFLGQLTSTIAAEGDTYSFSWLDPDKEVFVLQNRKFRKAGRLHLNIGAGLTTSGAFVDATTFQGRAGYFFKEDWGFEVVYSLNSGEENSTALSLRNEGSSGSVPFRRIVDNYMGGMVLWSPFYAKINTFNTIIYLDWIIGAGIAKLEETNNLIEFTTTPGNDVGTTLSHTGIMWDTGLKFYINQNFDVRMDLTVVHYKADKAVRNGTAESTYYSNWDLAFSLGYSF
jgi:outer membrane beta-barrel protein